MTTRYVTAGTASLRPGARLPLSVRKENSQAWTVYDAEGRIALDGVETMFRTLREAQAFVDHHSGG